MTLQEVKEILGIICDAFPRFDGKGHKVWHKALGMVSANKTETEAAVYKYILNNTWPPAVGDIIRLIRESRPTF